MIHHGQLPSRLERWGRRPGAITTAVLLTVGLLVTSACSPADSGNAPRSTLTIGQMFPITDTNPHPLSGDTLPWREAVFNELVGVGNGLEPTPELATSWTARNDDRTFTFKLRHGVEFSDGKPFTAKDVVWNIRYASNPKSGAQSGVQLAGAEATAVNSSTVRLQFAGPSPQVYSLLADTPMIEPGSKIMTAVRGTGPFRIDRLDPNRQMRLVRNTHYWRKGFPRLRQLVIKTIPDASSLTLNLRSGAVDGILNPPYQQVSSLRTSNLVKEPGTGNYNFLIAAKTRALKDSRVRRALSLAVDRDRFSNVATMGMSRPTCLAFPPNSPVWSKQLDDCHLDLTRARSLLAAAGYRNGLSVTLQYPTTLAPLATFAPLYQADLARIGVKAHLQGIEATQWIQLVVGGSFQSLVGHLYSYANLDPALLMTANPFDPKHNVEHYRNAHYARLVAKAEATVGSRARIEAFRKVAAFIRDQAFVIPVGTSPSVFAFARTVKGFKTNALYYPDFEDTTVGSG